MDGETLGPFRIKDKLGEGGMGEVWRAEDSRLGRDVALKILPEAFAADAERLARFEREARTLASLSHPRIAGIHEVGAADGRHYLVMELIEGEDLSERLSRGPLPTEEALELALQIVDGLEAAHSQGIVHRDLKPANLKVDPGGAVKILDFGLAKAMDLDSGVAPVPLSHSPTVAATMTQPGVLLGTAAYMSPEQARGKVVDQQADIWAFGCVLFEMLTGGTAYPGETVTDVLASVVAREPAWDELPSGTPRAVRRLLRRCLEKDPARRLHDIADARLELEDGLSSDSEASEAAAASAPAEGRRYLPWILALLGLIASLGFAAAWWSASRVVPPRVHLHLPPPEGGQFQSDSERPGVVAVSPDGRRIVFGARTSALDPPTLWVRSLDEASARELDGTERSSYPFWSPDSRRIAYFTEAGRLESVDADGGPPTVLCEASNGKGGTWNDDGVIVFAPGATTGLHRVADLGGDSEPLTELDATVGETSHRHPRFLPDGRRFIFLARSESSDEGSRDRWMVGDLEGGPPRELAQGSSNVEIASGHLLFGRGTTLMAQPFDVGAAEPVGRAFPLAEDVLAMPGAALLRFSVSNNGVLAFQTGDSGLEASTLAWSEPDGRELERLETDLQILGLRLDPSGTLAAWTVRDAESGEASIWVADLERDVRERLTFQEGSQFWPVWSRDGTTIAYLDAGPREIYLQEVFGSSEPRKVARIDGAGRLLVSGWTPDESALLVTVETDTEGEDFDVVEVPVDGGDQRVLLGSDHPEALATVSPDGRWVAFNAAISGLPEIYVTSYPEIGRRWKLSTGGGIYPSWSPQGDAIHFTSLSSGKLYRVAVDTSGGELRPGPQTEVLDLEPGFGMQKYDVGPDGRILSIAPPPPADSEPMSVVLSWTSGLSSR